MDDETEDEDIIDDEVIAEAIETLHESVDELQANVAELETKVDSIKKIKPKDGYTPIKGIDYTDGKPGKTPTAAELKKIIIPLIPPPIPGDPGKDAVVDEPKLIKKLKDEIKPAVYEVLSNTGHGGNANRDIKVNGTYVLTPFTDINLVQGANISLSTAANQTTKYTDITITATGGGGSVIGGVTSVLAGTGITVDSTTPANPIVALGNSSVVAGTYGSATTVGQFTVDQQGRISAASTIGITASGGTPAGADTQVQFNDGGSTFGATAGLTFNKNTSVLSASIVSVSTETISNAGTTNALKITQTGNTSASISVGGAVNITNTNNTGAGLVLFSNGAAGQVGRQFVVYSQASALAIDTALIQSDATNNTALNLKGVATGKGVLKVEHMGNTAGDANGSGISIQLGNGTNATSVQGIFIDAPTTGTDGKLLNIRSAGAEKFVVRPDGTITFNNAYTFPTSDGSTNQVLATNGLGVLAFASVAATGGSGITRTTSVITANTTGASSASVDYVYICSAGLAFTLPNAVGNNNLYTVKNASSSSILVVVVGGKTMDGSGSVISAINNQTLGFISDGSNYRIV